MSYLDEGHRNIDSLLEDDQRKKLDFLANLTNTSLPAKIKDYVPIGAECLRNMGNGTHNSAYSCTKCLELGRLVPLKNGEPSEFFIESGKHYGSKIRVFSEETPNYGVTWDQSARKIAEKLSKINNIGSCGIEGQALAERYLSSGNWLNGVLVNWCVESIFAQRRIPHVVGISSAFVCHDKGYSLRMDGSHTQKSCISLTSFSDWNEARVVSLFRQIGAALLTLKPYQFVHGTATLDKLEINTDEPCGYLFNSSRITGDFTLKIRDFHLSSIKIFETRLLPSTYGRNVDLCRAIAEFKPSVEGYEIPNVDISSASCSGDVCSVKRNAMIFRIGEAGPTLFTTMRYSGYPLFGGAFDTYSFLTSLITWKPIGQIVANSEKLTAIYTNLFPSSSDAPEIEYSEYPVTCSYEISKILRKNWMYCDAPEMLLELCDKYFPNS